MTVRHVFLFRHCVRSSPAELDIHDADPSAYSSNPADYLAVPLPDWQTAPMECTQVGSEISVNTGQYLLNTYLAQFGSVNQVSVHFVSDVDARDVDTSRDLMQGMALVEQANSSLHVQGLQTLQYDADLFSPTKPKWNSNQTFCEKAPADAMNQYLASRLGTVPPPGDVQEIEALIETYGGVGVVGPIADLPATFVNTNVSDLGGQINPVKYIAEAAFYAAASEIPFLPNISKSELFDLIAWIHYERSVTSVGNNDAALSGGVMMNRVLQTLANNINDDDDDGNNMHDQTATFLVGHDGNLDDVATALGLTWVLPEPYRSGKDGIWTPTPPNTGLHFVYDPDKNLQEVTISVLTPMYFSKKGEDLIVNKTGILEERPVLVAKRHELTDETVRVDKGRTIVSSQNPQKTGLDSLHERLELILQSYEGAAECYQKAKATFTPPPATLAPTPNPSVPTTHNETPRPYNNNNIPTPYFHTEAPTKAQTAPKPSSAKGKVFSTWMVFVVMAAGFIYLVRSVRRRRGRGGRTASYTEMGDARHDLDLEMT